MNKLLLALATVALTGTSANAIIIESTLYNGHRYRLVESPGISWEAAQAHATTFRDGYLAVLSDPAELSAVYGALINNGFFNTGGGQSAQAWLGARPADGSFSTWDASNWAWVTGETWTMDAYFFSGEPNGDSSGLGINRFGTSQFNDESGFVGGYIVESAPDGGTTLGLFGLALCAVGFLRRKSA